MSQQIRLFVGNVPPDVEESALSAEFSHYGKVTGVQIKEKKGIQDEIDKFAFVNVEIDNYNLNKCISEFSQQKFKGRTLRVSIAKESFMDRLKREREENEKRKNVESKNSSVETCENKKRIAPIEVDYNIVVPAKIKNTTASDDQIQSDSFRDSSNFKKRIKMTSSQENISEAKRLPLNDKELHVSATNVEKKLNPSDIKRLEAIKNMKEEYKKKKNLLKNTLLNIDNKSNKKIVFNEDGEAIVNDEIELKKADHKKFNSEYSTPKFSSSIINGDKNKPNKKIENADKKLFNEDSDGDEEDEYNFEIKKQFQGEAGQKLIELQSRYKSDKRFVLDERFIEEDDKNPVDNLDTIDTMEDSEKSKQYEILDSVLGTSFGSNLNQASKKTSFKTMLRYDPTRMDHSKFINVPQKLENNENKPKKRKKDLNDEAEGENIKPAPIISQDRYYKVDNSLKQAMEDKNPFSLLSLFGAEKAPESKSEDYITEEIEKVDSKVKNPMSGSKNPFYYDSSDSDENDVSKTPETGKIVPETTEDRAKSFSIGEKLFFSNNDKRLQEGLEFFLNKNVISNESRDKLKFIVKKRIYNNMKNDNFRAEKAGRRSARLTRFKRKK